MANPRKFLTNLAGPTSKATSFFNKKKETELQKWLHYRWKELQSGSLNMQEALLCYEELANLHPNSISHTTRKIDIEEAFKQNIKLYNYYGDLPKNLTDEDQNYLKCLGINNTTTKPPKSNVGTFSKAKNKLNNLGKTNHSLSPSKKLTVQAKLNTFFQGKKEALGLLETIFNNPNLNKELSGYLFNNISNSAVGNSSQASKKRFSITQLQDNEYWETAYTMYNESDDLIWKDVYKKIEKLRDDFGLNKRYKNFPSFKRSKTTYNKKRMKGNN